MCAEQHKGGLASSAKCECGANEHIILTRPIHRAPRGTMGLIVLDEETRPASDLGNTADWGSKR